MKERRKISPMFRKSFVLVYAALDLAQAFHLGFRINVPVTQSKQNTIYIFGTFARDVDPTAKSGRVVACARLAKRTHPAELVIHTAQSLLFASIGQSFINGMFSAVEMLPLGSLPVKIWE